MYGHFSVVEVGGDGDVSMRRGLVGGVLDVVERRGGCV